MEKILGLITGMLVLALGAIVILFAHNPSGPTPIETTAVPPFNRRTRHGATDCRSAITRTPLAGTSGQQQHPQ